ncbi:hypothetical protein B1H58_11785 [Pantoea alhagi]|uniref:Uncharacterized protein n=1 Tax=Pantoea alhagi TaxID=1891675 RepID=A0A1W6B6C2_9GAMM|nr:hypothetical protein B1H58_11785 [Pantoea alhagi]
MNTQDIIRLIISRILRGLGMGIASAGLLFCIWFFFFSIDESRYIWGISSFALIIPGYFIYRMAIIKIFDER